METKYLFLGAQNSSFYKYSNLVVVNWVEGNKTQILYPFDLQFMWFFKCVVGKVNMENPGLYILFYS